MIIQPPTFLRSSLIIHRYINSTIIIIFIACCFTREALNSSIYKLVLNIDLITLTEELSIGNEPKGR